MAAIDIGRVCIKTAGREAGNVCVILDIVDKNFVEVVGPNVKHRRCNIKHLEPTNKKIDIDTDDIEEIKKNLKNLKKK